MKKIVAVIPIRKGSQRVPNKNLKKFCETTLLENKIDVLLNVKAIDEIIVNTDSDEAISIVNTKYKNTNVKYFRRDDYYASSICSGSDFFKNLGESTNCDIFIYAPCTSPFISVDTYNKCINTYLNLEKDYDSVATVSQIKEFLWLNGNAINYDPLNAPNSQNLPNIVALNFGVSIIDKNLLVEKHNIIGYKPYFIETDEIESVDIDTPFDFSFAEYIKNNIINNE